MFSIYFFVPLIGNDHQLRYLAALPADLSSIESAVIEVPSKFLGEVFITSCAKPLCLPTCTISVAIDTLQLPE